MFLGSIRNVTLGRKMGNLEVFDEGIVVAKGDLRPMIARLGGSLAFGGKGFRAGDAVAKMAEKSHDDAISKVTYEELLASDPSNRFIAFEGVSAVRLWHPWFPPIYRVDLHMADGTTDRFEWKRLHNEPHEVADLLRRAVGDRLTTDPI
jgi:hypothetical protein